jgi:ankyrin repeat protein
MKTKFFVLIFLLATAAIRAQTNNLTVLLQQGLLEEQANGNLDAAIADYRSLAVEFDKDRPLAATAVFRLGECYRAQGKTKEAAAQYQRILREFPDQETLATMSRQNLTGLGATAAEAQPAENADARLWNAVKNLPPPQLEKVLPTLAPDAVLASMVQQRNENEIKLAETRKQYGEQYFLVATQKADMEAANKQIAERIDGIMQALKLRAEMSKTSVISAASASSNDVASDEDREIQRIGQMVQNSPDLINRSSGDTRQTPLCAAAKKGQLRVAEFLLANGAEVNLKSANSLTPLQSAAGAGQNAMVQLLLDHNAAVDAGGETPLIEVAGRGFKAVVGTLLAHHANVNAQDSNGTTPLHTAADSSNLEIVELLLAHGANVNIKDNHGRTPLSWAAFRVQNTAVVKALLDAKADPNAGELDAPLLGAIHIQDAVSAEMLLQAGANPNTKGKVDWEVRFDNALYPSDTSVTPLFLAVLTKQLPIVQLVLKFKADPNGSQTDGRPLLFGALSDTNILEALLDSGAKIDASETVKILKAPGNYQFIKRTSLNVAASQNNADAVEILLKHGANPNTQDERGDTALHWATLFQLPDEKVFKLLLDHNANPNVRDDSGKTPLDLLKEKLPQYPTPEQENLLDLLHKHGALENLPNWDRIEVASASAQSPTPVFWKGTNSWNRFTLLQTILSYYVKGYEYGRPEQPHNKPFPGAVRSPKEPANTVAFPDLTRVVIVRPNHGSTNATRITVNLLNSTNGIDCSKDVPLEFGDMVEIPQRDHSLGEAAVRLTGGQVDSIVNYLNWDVQLIVRDQKAELPLEPFGDASTIGAVLRQTAAQQLILSSSDLSRVKVSRNDPKTGEKHEWILDCGNPSLSPDLWLRDGDVIELPEKP